MALELSTRAVLEARWLELTRVVLPGVAKTRRWPIVNDHCFQRVLLDAAVGRCWYDVITGRPAYRHADAAILRSAVEFADSVAAGDVDLVQLNAQSLGWRRARKQTCSSAASGPNKLQNTTQET